MSTMIDINSIDIIEFLSKLGIYPVESKGSEYLYLSPFRNEKKPSFLVNPKKNCWYDFGIVGQTDWGLIGFIKKYYAIDEFKECLKVLAEVMELPTQDFKCSSTERKTVLELIREEDITDPKVIEYIKSRKVSLTTTKKYLRQCIFKFYDQERLGLSYSNSLGGTEILALDGMKCSLKNKSYTFIAGDGDYNVFEGMFDMISYLYLIKKRRSARNIIVLNSVTSIHKAMNEIDPLATVHSFLDRDKAGIEATSVLSSNFRCIDHSPQYEGYNDLNDMLKG